MDRKKEHATHYFMRTVYDSWTYDRMTEDERGRLESAIDFADRQGMVKGAFDTRWNVLQAVYNAFLMGIGYDGMNWREPNPEQVPNF